MGIAGPLTEKGGQVKPSMLTANRIQRIDALSGMQALPDESVDCIVTSPPYWSLRDYGMDGQLGLEETFEKYLVSLLAIFDEAQRVLKKSGTCWVNLGDCYGGRKPRKQSGTDNPPNKPNAAVFPSSAHTKNRWDKCLLGIPERFAAAMLDRGWTLRNKIIWHKPNHMPCSVKDRFANSWEYIFFFVKSKRYYFDLDAVRVPPKTGKRAFGIFRPRKSKTEPRFGGKSKYGQFVGLAFNHVKGKNPGDCWIVPPRPFAGAHFAVFPEALIERPIQAGCPALVCERCGKPKRQTAQHGGNTHAFNMRVQDVKSGRIKHQDRKASGQEISEYAGKYVSPTRTVIIAPGCHCRAGFEPGLVLDPFMGSGTTAIVAKRFGRRYLGFELNGEYVKLARRRIRAEDDRAAA